MSSRSDVNSYGRQLTPAEIAERQHREFVGGLWDEVGSLQFGFMRSRGLQPTNRLVDVGCGALRGGIHFVRYLAPGNYYGLDVNASLIDAGKRELGDVHLRHKQPHLLVSDTFDCGAFGTTFPYALAVSLFSHLNMNLIIACLANVRGVLEPNGRFYASYWEAPTSAHLEPLRHPSGIVTYYGSDSYHYSFEEMQGMAERSGMRVERIGDWGHPRGQTMLAFQPL